MEQHLRPVHTLGVTASALAGLVALGNFAEAGATWYLYTAYHDYRAGDGPETDVLHAEVVVSTIDIVFTVVTVLAVVAFMMWTYNARLNAESLAPDHRLGRGWVVFGWIVPVVSLWFPKTVVDDIWRASDPRLRDIPLRARPRPALTTRWWTAYLLMWFLDLSYLNVYENGRITVDSVLTLAVLNTLAAAVGIVAVVLVAQVIRRINDLQTVPAPV